MYLAAVGVFLPDFIVCFHVDAFQAVPGDDVEFPDGVIVFGGIAGGDDNPASRDPMPSEDFVLQVYIFINEIIVFNNFLFI